MVDDVKNCEENTQHKVGELDPVERARLVRSRREAEQRRRLDELRAHALAAQNQREAREEERRRRAEHARVKEDERRALVEERKRAITESAAERRAALAEREKERAMRVEAARAARLPPPKVPFAFGSSTPRLLEPADTGGMLWSHRRAVSTSNVMSSSTPLTRRPSFYDLDRPDNNVRSDDMKDEGERSPSVWSSVARRKTDLVPTIPAPRNNGVGRAYSMTRLDKAGRTTPRAHSGSMVHLNRAGKKESGLRSGSSTPMSRPGSACSVPRRPSSAPRRPRPTSFTPTGSTDENETPRRPRPLSMHVSTVSTPVSEGKPPIQRKPKPSKENTPKARSVSPSGERIVNDRTITRSARDSKKEKSKTDQVNASEVTQKLEALQIHNKSAEKPALAPKPDVKKSAQKSVPKTTPHKVENETKKPASEVVKQNIETTNIVSSLTPCNVTLTKNNVTVTANNVTTTTNEVTVTTNNVTSTKTSDITTNQVAPVGLLDSNVAFIEFEKKHTSDGIESSDVDVVVITDEVKIADEVKTVDLKPDVELEKKPVTDKHEDVDMSASMMSRSMRITTEEEAKAALAERRRKAREEAEQKAREEQERLAREAEEEKVRQLEEEERERQLEEEAKELAALQRKTEEEKLRKAIEEQQQLAARAEEERLRAEEERVRAEAERAKAEVEKAKAEAERRAELQREEEERRERRKRVEAIMARTRKKEKQEEEAAAAAQNNSSVTENNNSKSDLLENGNKINGDEQTNALQTNQSKQENVLISFESGDGSVPANVTVNSPDKNVMSETVNLIDISVESDNKMAELVEGNIMADNAKIADNNGFTLQNGHKDNNKEFDVLNNGSHHPLTNAV